MFNSLQGEITRKGLDQLFLQSGDLEWDLAVSLNTLNSLPPVGSRAKVYTYLLHKEDQMKLIGFSSIQERALFLDLIKVSGVGPKVALKFLSGLKYTEFAVALDAGDTAKLSKVPGLGLKTAQKIVLALKGKLNLEDSQPQYSPYAEIVASLSEMGFDRKAAEKALAEVLPEIDLAGKSELDKEKLLFQKALFRLSTQG